MPGLWTPWNVPMIPDADIVAISGSVSNHWRRKSAALIVISWTKTACCFSGSFWKARSRPVSGASWRGSRPVRSGGTIAQDRLDEPGHLDHQLAVFLVGLGVAEAPAAELADRPAVVVDPPQVVVLERRERAVEGQDVEAVLRQVELADDLGPEQADDVAGDAEPEAREDLLGHRGPAEQMALLEDDGLQPGPGQVGGADEAVVAAADDDRVVASATCSSVVGRAVPGAPARYAGCMGSMQSSGPPIGPCITSVSAAGASRRCRGSGILRRSQSEEPALSVGTAFHPRTEPHNRKMQWREWSGYFAASVYADFHDIEYNAIREQAALIDVSPLYKYEVRGRDALSSSSTG